MTLNQEHVTQLVLEAQSGNRSALGRLLRQYEDLMYPLALKYCGDEEVAKDAVQDACLQVVRKLNTLREPSKFKSWVCQIVVNCVRLQYRRKARYAPFYSSVALKLTDAMPIADSLAEARDELGVVTDWLDEHYHEDSYFLDLVSGHDVTLKSISEETGLSVGALKTRIHRIRKHLRTHMEHLQRLPRHSYRPSGHTPSYRTRSTEMVGAA